MFVKKMGAIVKERFIDEFERGLVSIITPAYNVENVIDETISNVLRQTYTNWELILVDDCSSDNTLEVCRSYQNNNSNVFVYTNSMNSGSGHTRNVALKKAKGQYVAFLDSDDIWDRRKLENQLRFMKENDAAICHTSFSFVDEDGRKRPGKVNATSIVDLESNLRNTEIGTSTAIINRDLVKETFLFSNIRARQDLKLWIDLLSSGYVSHGLDEMLVEYRVRENSVSSNKLKMLAVTLKVYLGVDSLPFYKRLSCYVSYVFNAIKKRRR
ncbi:TPA: glycosyltransferase family 2 protein [Vibrio parahaemolyticus]